MRRLIDDIKFSFGNAQALYRLMAVNVGVFLVLMLMRTVLFLSGGGDFLYTFLVRQLSLPADPFSIVLQPWSLLTYMFLHTDLLHILFNMLVLFWTGRLFCEYLGNRKLTGVYLMGGLSGASLYLLAYQLFPAFDGASSGAHLLGASAGVIAVMVGIATLLPEYTVHLLLIGPVRLKFVAAFSVVLYFISIPMGNAGGHIAHLGGALAGFFIVRALQKGRDLTSWLSFFERKGSNTKGRRRMKVVSRKSLSDDEIFRRDQVASQELVDRILDKINKSGFDSLTNAEKEVLYRASKKS